jgi:hypothetical protein
MTASGREDTELIARPIVFDWRVRCSKLFDAGNATWSDSTPVCGHDLSELALARFLAEAHRFFIAALSVGRPAPDIRWRLLSTADDFGSAVSEDY